MSPLSGKLVCGDCGGFFGSKVWNSTNKYRKVIWRCNNRYKKNGKKDCTTHHVVESEVQYRFITAYNRLMADKSDIFDGCQTALAVLSDTSDIDAEIKSLEEEVEVVEGLAMQAIEDNKRRVIDQSEWMERNGKYIKRHERATERLKELDRQKEETVNKARTIRRFITQIKSGADVLTEWSEDLCSAVIDKVVIGVDGSMTFCFKNGRKIRE